MSFRPALLALVAIVVLAASPSLAKECKGLKSAHCHCRAVYGGHTSPISPDHLITPDGWQGKELFTYTIPNRCFNQQADPGISHLGNGCWKACRDAYGIDGATKDPAIRPLLLATGKNLRAAGFCGGWVTGDAFYAAGTNKYRSNMANGLGITVGGSVVIKDGKKICK